MDTRGSPHEQHVRATY